jgi:hypothetical protein
VPLLITRYWCEHTEWHIGKPGDKLNSTYTENISSGPRPNPAFDWLLGALNYAVPEVCKLRLDQLRECCERFPIDGLDFDFQRFPMYFRPGEEKANVGQPQKCPHRREVERGHGNDDHEPGDSEARCFHGISPRFLACWITCLLGSQTRPLNSAVVRLNFVTCESARVECLKDASWQVQREEPNWGNLNFDCCELLANRRRNP